MLRSDYGDLDSFDLYLVANEKGELSGEARLRSPNNPGLYYSMPLADALARRYGLGGMLEFVRIRLEYDNIRPPDWGLPGVGRTDGGGVNYYPGV